MAVETNLRVIWPTDDRQSDEFIHKLDIVFVHGLNPTGHALHGSKTWKTESGIIWPSDQLPSKVDYARIVLFEYNSSVAIDASEMDIRGHADSLLDLLQGLREETDSTAHPILFVGHSLGGLVIKQALVLAKQNNRVYKDILQSTRGIVFFATPHRGGNGTTLGEVAGRAAAFLTGSGRNDLVKSLKKKSKYLAQLSADFSHQYEDYQFLTVVESRPLFRTPLTPVRTVVVDRDSAVLGLPGHRERVIELDRDHREICKFEDGPEFTRVARHLKRIAEDAIGNITPVCTPGGNGSLSLTTPQSYSSDAKITAESVRLYSTLDQRSHGPVIGQGELFAWLEHFLDQESEMYLVLWGPAGTGKSTVIHDAAWRWSERVSVFWFSAESPRALERGFRSVSRLVHVDKPQSFKDWLVNSHCGPWIAIFDNAYAGLDLRKLLPRTGGKVLVTARHTNILANSGLTTRQMPSFTPDDAVQLFISRWSEQRRPFEVDWKTSLPPSITDLLHTLTDRPLAITLAATCASFTSIEAANRYLHILGDEDPMDAGGVDPKIWKWGYHLLDELGENELYLLGVLCVFDSDWITDDFLDFLANDTEQRSIFSSRQYTRFLDRLLKLSLVKRQRNSVRQYYYIPLAVKECVVHYANTVAKHTSMQDIVNEGCKLLALSLTTAKLEPKDDYHKSLRVAYAHIHSICLATETHGAFPGGTIVSFLDEISQVALYEAISETTSFLFDRFWRTWLQNNNLPLHESTVIEDDCPELIVHPPFPSWIISRSPANSIENEELRETISELIVPGLADHFLSSAGVAAIWRGWNSMKQDIVRYASTHENTTRNTEILFHLETGGCEGQFHCVQSVRSDECVRKATADGKKWLQDLIDIIVGFLVDSKIQASDLDAETLSRADTALRASWGRLLPCSCHMAGAFEGWLKEGCIVDLVRGVVDQGLTDHAKPQFFAQTVSLIVGNTGASHFKARLALALRGAWEVLSGLTIFLAAEILRELSSAVKVAGPEAERFVAASSALTTGSIDMVRASIMTNFSSENSPGLEQALTKATFWCVQAEECRKVWRTSVEVGKYRDQDSWEEYRILSGFTGEWPILDNICRKT